MDVDEVYAIETTSRSGGAAVSVQLCSGERYVISALSLSALGLAGGDPVDAETLEKLGSAAAEWRAERTLLRLLARRPRSQAEIERRLTGWDVPAEAAQRLLRRLADAGLVDDDRMAQDLSDSLRRRGHGSLRAAHDLERFGVADGPVSAAVQHHGAADTEIAREVLLTRFGESPYDPPTLRRAAGLLARRGFDEHTIEQVLGYDDA
jgi:regulatory protein